MTDDELEAMVNEAMADTDVPDGYGIPLAVPEGPMVPDWAFTDEHIISIAQMLDRFARVRYSGMEWRTTIEAYGETEVASAGVSLTGNPWSDAAQVAVAALLVRQVHPGYVVMVGDAVISDEIIVPGQVKTAGSVEFDSKEAASMPRAVWVNYLVRVPDTPGCAVFVLHQPYIVTSTGAPLWDHEVNQWVMARPEATDSKVIEALTGALSWDTGDPFIDAEMDKHTATAMGRDVSQVGIAFTKRPR